MSPSLRSRAAIDRHHDRQLRLLTWRAARDLPFYRAFADHPFAAWPVIDKETVLANFAGMNRIALDAATVRAALEAGEERLSGHLIGMSTGTSGNRGYYVITERERFVWLGTILAKALPDALWRRHRVAHRAPGPAGAVGCGAAGHRGHRGGAGGPHHARLPGAVGRRDRSGDGGSSLERLAAVETTILCHARLPLCLPGQDVSIAARP